MHHRNPARPAGFFIIKPRLLPNPKFAAAAVKTAARK
jgi:hypothetical protein